MYMTRVSGRAQESEDHMTLEQIFSKPMWGAPECSISHNYGSKKCSVSKPVKNLISCEYFMLFPHLH